MNDYSDLILKYRSCEMTIAEREEFNRNFALNMMIRKEFLFQEKLDKVMKESLLLDAIENDPDLIKAEILARHDVDSRNVNGIINKEDVLAGMAVETEMDLRNRIAKAELEMVISGIDNITGNWTREFEKRKPGLDSLPETLQIKELIKQSEPFDDQIIRMDSMRYSFTRKTLLRAAAAAVVLGFLVFKSLTPSNSVDSIYTANYEPLAANSFQLRGSDTQSDNELLQEGVNYYLLKEYTKAAPVFDNLLKTNKNLPEALLFSGLNQMEQKNFQGAIASFKELLSAEVQFVPEAQWYLGLCYIKTGDLENGRALMTVVAGSEGIYKRRAQGILKTLIR